MGSGDYSTEELLTELVAARNTSKAQYGLANLAAFLAQTLQETIQYDACDENNWSDAAVAASPRAGAPHAVR